MVTCSRCGTEARDGSRFCGVCGQPIAADRPAAAGKGPAAPAGKVAVGIPAGKQAGFAGAAPVPERAPGASSNRTVAMVAGGVLLLAVVALVAVLLTRPDGDGEVSTDGDADAASATDVGADDGDDTGSAASDDGDDGSSGPGSSDANPPPTTRPAPVEILNPVRVTPTNTRDSVELRCGGTADYGAWNLFDGNPNTGWGASASDGTGQSVRMDFGGPVRLAQVGITPGFTKVGLRFDQGCASVNAFPFNHFIAEVQWTFDDGSSVNQTFEQRGTLQFTRVDTTTRSVTMTIVRTELPPGADPDTVISTMEIRGSR